MTGKPADPWNPSATEVREWAYGREPLEPCQEWHLVLSWTRHEDTYLELVNDPQCSSRTNMLDVLYLIVGNAVRNDSLPRPILAGFLEKAKTYNHPDIRPWRERSEALLQNPEELDFELWCAGGYARAAT